MRRLAACVAVTLAAAAAPPARAQDNSAEVEALFNDGKKLEQEGNYAAACPKFLASFNLDHRTGTLLNLADCYEKTGMFASAWARFVEARTAALRAGQNDRADFAKQHADALEAKLSKLTVLVPHPVSGIRVTRDGTLVDAAAIGVAVPVDPGDHVVEASAPGKNAWKGTVHVGDVSDAKAIEVPELTDAPQEAPVAPVVAEKGGLSGGRIAGIATAGAGVVSLGIGAVFGVIALGKESDSNKDCNVNGVANDCYPAGATLRRDAVNDGNLSSIFLGVGGALVIGGVVLWLTTSPSHPASVAFDGRGVRFSGAF